jgi:hypothetical protein
MKHAANINHLYDEGGAARGQSSGGDIARAVVVKVTVAVAACVPSSVTDEGETLHTAAAGAPVQLQITVCVDPFTGAAETV